MSKTRINYYSEHLPKTLQEAYLLAVDDKDKLNLDNELALLRTLLASLIRSVPADDEGNLQVDEKEVKAISNLVDKIGRIQSAISTHEMKMKQHLHVSMIPVMIQSICNIVRNVIQDEEAVARISSSIANIPLFSASPVEIEAKSE